MDARSVNSQGNVQPVIQQDPGFSLSRAFDRRVRQLNERTSAQILFADLDQIDTSQDCLLYQDGKGCFP